FLTPYEKIIEDWKTNPELFYINPLHFKTGLNN
ncbi:MAG: IS481 family transposase, partial [Alphaproteobacteria bacterium]|nr:IS481 family transposase [Alphaproteobacteria bacterium]